jgi:hypothetical protein
VPSTESGRAASTKPPASSKPSMEADEDEDLDKSPTERADKLSFQTEANTWDTQKTYVQVAKKMFAFGHKNGCIFLREQDQR